MAAATIFMSPPKKDLSAVFYGRPVDDPYAATIQSNIHS
jgi:hypothetical protein